MSELDDQWEKEVIVKLLTESQKEKQIARRWKIAFRFIYIGLFLLFLVILPAVMSLGKLSTMTSDHVAVIDLTGTIDSENDSIGFLLTSMENAYKNPSVKAIILRANSPGGSPVISGNAYDEIVTLKKNNKGIPIYAVVEDVCASGCYYIVSAADKIYANQASLVGSIGVISGGFGFDKAIEKLGIERRLKTAGANKGMGDSFSPENPAQAVIWQELLNEVHQQFITAVKQGRGKVLKDKEDQDIFSGRVYTGSQGLNNGLVDGLGNVRSVAREAKLPVVNYTIESKGLAKYLGKGIRGEIKQSVDSFTQLGW